MEESEEELDVPITDNDELMEETSEKQEVDAKEAIELDLAISGQTDADFEDNALTESDVEKGTDYEEDDEEDFEVPTVDIVPIVQSLHSSQEEAVDKIDAESAVEIEARKSVSNSETAMDVSPEEYKYEDVSTTDFSSVDHREQEVQSELGASEELPIHGYIIEADVFDKDSMISALFNKSPIPHDKCEVCKIQVTTFLPTNQSVTKYFLANTNVSELKNDLGKTLGTRPENLLLSLMGNTSGEYLNDWTPLVGIAPNSVGGLILNLSYKFDAEIKNIVDFPSIETYAPIITVRQVHIRDIYDKEKIVTVVTEDISYVKEWLGGFRNTKTGQMYHNASTETRYWERKPKVESPVKTNSRDAQTHLPYTTKFTQVDANKGTQMWRPDHYIQSTSDKIIAAKPYVEYHLRTEQRDMLESAIKIQRWYRRQVSRRNIRLAFSKLIQLIRKQREKRSAADANLNNEKILYLLSITFPTTRNDFFNMYSIVVMWWTKQFNQISKIKSISERRAAYYNLLQDEIQLLAALENQKIKSKAEALKRRDMKLIEETSRPIIRYQRKRNMTIVDTLEVQRAREIKEIYMTYISNNLDKKQRIQVILSLLDVVETFDEIDYTKDLIKLMRREIDMVSMGIDDTYLLGLRKRIQEGIFHFVRDKEFNPQAKNFRPIHFPRVELRSYRCKGCRKLKVPADFPIHVRLSSYRNCSSCDWLQMTGHQVLNIAPYSSILKLLRAREVTKCPRSTYCFLLQPFGAYFIINTIWNGKSALSESMNLPELRLCRWDNKQEWSPWNSILLTVEEAEVHERIYENSEVYEEEFIQSIKVKHITTKFHFKLMDETDVYSRETGLWDSALDENIYQHMFHKKEALKPVDPIFKPPLDKKFVNPCHSKKLVPCSKSKS